MTDKPTRRDLMKPVQLLGLAFVAALFAGVVTLISMGFFQNRVPGQSGHALMVGGVVAGITFIATLVVISLLMLAVDPAQVTKQVDRPLLLPTDEASAGQTPADPVSGASADPVSGASASDEAAPRDPDDRPSV